MGLTECPTLPATRYPLQANFRAGYDHVPVNMRRCTAAILLAFLPQVAAYGAGEEARSLADLAWGSIQARDRAKELVKAGRVAEATAVLAAEVERSGYFPAAEALWNHYLAIGEKGEAENLVRRLLARKEDPEAVGAGHALAARQAILAGDRSVVEGHYRAYLVGPHPLDEVAAEYVAFAFPQKSQGEQRMALAQELCGDNYLDAPFVDHCTAELLRMAGDARGALDSAAAWAAGRPHDAVVLRNLAQAAQAAGDWETAEATWRRVVELDPTDTLGWWGLALFYRERDELAALEALAADARKALLQVPTDVLKALASVLVKHGQARRAIDVLLQARAAEKSDEERAWISLQLREAYAALAQEPR